MDAADWQELLNPTCDVHDTTCFTRTWAIGAIETFGAMFLLRGPSKAPTNTAETPPTITTIGRQTTAKTADDLMPGVRQGWAGRVADNGKGKVWQQPGATGNANSVRVMESTERYPNGYVRFYNDRGQPIGLNGKPGPNSETHIPRGPDGLYELPEGW